MADENKDEEENIIQDIQPVNDLYENWFLDYASYVILERAVPSIVDGLKPVQRRIMHALKEIDDGRFNKVANIIGSTMQFHPHGDASINDAIVNLGQKDLLIETQGNWGDIRTGDNAAAPRYIEARLSKFALEVAFNEKLTEWQLSYDGRKREPVFLPMKFPLLLAQGVEGIAVGLATKIMPHNFIELCDGSIKILKDKRVSIVPDFPNGGMADFSQYNDGLKGGKIKVRSHIEVYDKKTLVIKDIPYGTTTVNLIESIIKANDSGKIKIKQVVDNTARDIEIFVYLSPGVSPDITIDALYAFTDCEISISPNACVIVEDKPRFMGVNEMLRISTANTKDLLNKELELRRNELLEKLLFSSLEKIFIENRIYRDIEECETWEAVIKTIDKGLDPFKKDFYREITDDDIVRLTEIKIKRISKFDAFKADELMNRLQEELKEVEHHLANLTDFSIAYFEKLKEKYGKGRERKTEIKSFDSIEAHVVAANNVKLYINREDGFMGHGLKKDEFVTDCSDLDDIIVFRSDGKYQISRISDKVFVGKGIIHAGIFKKTDERMVYHCVYLDGKSGRSMIKRFQVSSVTRDKEYDLTTGAKGCRVHYFSANPNGENEIITVKLTAGSKARNKTFDFDFSTLEIKGRNAKGNILTKYPVRKIELLEKGASTLGGLEIWYDDTTGRLNREERGYSLGEFNGEDQILTLYQDGSYELTSFELTNRYDPNKVIKLYKFDENQPINAIHYDGDSKNNYVKRFQVETRTQNKRFTFIGESKGSKLHWAGYGRETELEVTIKKGSKGVDKKKVDLEELIDIKGWKSIGNKFPIEKFHKLELMGSRSEAKQPDILVKSEEKKADQKEKPGKRVEVEEEENKDSKPEASKKVEKEESKNTKKDDPNADSDKQDTSSKEGDTLSPGTSIELDVKPKKDDNSQLGMFGEEK